VRLSRRLINTKLDAILVLSNTDRFTTHETLGRFHYLKRGPETGQRRTRGRVARAHTCAHEQRFSSGRSMPDRPSQLAPVAFARHEKEAGMD
jgi:hypothetical protein